MSKDYTKEISEFLSSKNIAFKAHFIPQTIATLTKGARLNFKIELIKGSNVVDFDYFKGQGNCLANRVNKARLDRSYHTKNRLILDELQTGRCDLGKTKQPTAADVIYCLLLDYDSGVMSFDEFCNEFGYDNDSMTNFKVYRTCTESAKKLSLIFSASDIESLCVILEGF
jgi:hypothetical protein